MRITNLKRGIYDALLSLKFDSNEDKIIISCLLFDFVKNIISNENDNENTIKELAKNYAENYRNILSEFKKKFVSYTVMIRRIAEYNKDVFISLTDKQINEIIALYRDKTQLIPFSINNFSQYMYKILTLSFKGYGKLSENHFKVISPIIRYYIDNYNLSESDLEIFDAELFPSNPGKGILFNIKGINPSKIVNDIKQNRIIIDYYSVETFKNYVKIILL
jgi:hypothetical protein